MMKWVSGRLGEPACWPIDVAETTQEHEHDKARIVLNFSRLLIRDPAVFNFIRLFRKLYGGSRRKSDPTVFNFSRLLLKVDGSRSGAAPQSNSLQLQPLTSQSRWEQERSGSAIQQSSTSAAYFPNSTGAGASLELQPLISQTWRE